MRRLARPLLYAGTVAIVVGLGRYHAQFIGHYYFHSAQRLPWNLTYAAVLCLAADGFGLPDLDRRRSAWGPAIAAAGTGAVAISAFQLISGSLSLPRFVVFSGALFAALWSAVCVGIADIGRTRDEDRDRIVVIAGADEQGALEAEMIGMPERPAQLVAALSPDEASSSDPRSKPLIEAVLEHRATVVVLDRAASLDDSVVGQAAALHEAGLRVRSLSFFYEEWLGKLPISELERTALMFDIGGLHRSTSARVKRLFDVAAGLTGMALLVVVTPFVLVGNLLANRGPLLYRQERVGTGSRSYQMLKFRTMRADDGPGRWTDEGDDRITPFGGLLRRTHLDELPQMLNILRGEQSLVGPRPEQPHYVAELRAKIPFYDLRHLVVPGLTGWAQVKYRYGASETDALEKLQYDFYYLRHQDLALDARILGRTLRSVIGRAGR